MGKLKKLWFRRFLFVLLASILLIFLNPITAFYTNRISVDEDAVFRTSSNNATFVMGADFSFYRIEINSTHLWMDKSYTTKYYTRYSIQVTPYENFRTYTRVDPNNHIDLVGTTHIDHYAIQNEGAYLYKDEGLNHFTDFEHKLDIKSDFAQSNSEAFVWSVASHVGSYDEITGTGKTALFLYFWGTNNILYLQENYETQPIQSDSKSGLVADTWYYVRVKKDGTAFTCRIWTNATDRDNNDVGAGSYVDELTITLYADHSFQYIYGCNTENAGNNYYMNTEIENLDLQEVTSPQFTVNSWFATKDSSGRLTIDSPLSTDINMAFQSPNLLSASVSGDVSNSELWNSTTKRLSFTVNSDVSSSFTISASVGETKEENITPENVAVVITDMEGCGSWVFSEESYYTFQAKYWDGDGYADLETMKIRFSDGKTSVIAVYEDGEWSLESGSTVVRIRSGTVTLLGSNTLQVTFPIYFQNTVLDASDVDLYMWCNDASGVSDGWDLMQSDYFNIYNLGGRSTLESSGDAGRLDGGDVFDLYARPDSWVEASMIFRSLTHVKMLPTVWTNTGGEFEIHYYIDYCTDEDDWIEGWGFKMRVKNYWAGSYRFVNSTVYWYQGDNLVKSEEVSMFFAPATQISNMTFRFWVDLWFNRVNASSTVGGRINAYYFPMKDGSAAWLRWLVGSNWGIYEEKVKQSMMFTDLIDSDGNIIHASEVKMVQVRCKLVGPDYPYPTIIWRLSDYDVFDLTFGSDPMEGIQTPVFDETRVPVMPQGGFLGAVISAFHGLITWLSDNIIFGGLNLWGNFVNFIDTIFGFFGYPKAFSNFLDMLDDFWGWMTVSFGYIASFLASVFIFLNAIMTKFLNTTSSVIIAWVSVFQGVFNALGDGLGTGINIWNDLNLSTWVILIAIFYPVYLFMLWDQKGIDAVINQLRFLMDVASWIIRILITVIQMAIRLIQTIIESIPVIE